MTVVSVTNNSNYLCDILDLVWLNQNSEQKLWLPLLYKNGLSIPKRGNLLRDLKRAFSFSSCSSPVQMCFARWENCLIKLQPSLEFECLLLSESFHNDSEFILDIFRGVFFCGLLFLQWENFVICRLVIPAWDDHPTCVKCRFSAGNCSVDIHNPCSICQSWSLITWWKLRKSLRGARQKSTKRGTPALVVSASRPASLDGLCIYQLRVIIRDWLNC